MEQAVLFLFVLIGINVLILIGFAVLGLGLVMAIRYGRNSKDAKLTSLGIDSNTLEKLRELKEIVSQLQDNNEKAHHDFEEVCGWYNVALEKNADLERRCAEYAAVNAKLEVEANSFSSADRCRLADLKRQIAEAPIFSIRSGVWSIRQESECKTLGDFTSRLVDIQPIGKKE